MERRLGADFDIFHEFLQWNDLVTRTWPKAQTKAIADDGLELTRFGGHLILDGVQGKGGPDGSFIEVSRGVPA